MLLRRVKIVTNFFTCVDRGEHQENAPFYAIVVDNHPQRTAKARSANVEDIFQVFSRPVFRTIERQWTNCSKSVFFDSSFGVLHMFDYMSKDIAKIDAFSPILSNIRSINKFVKGHKHVRAVSANLMF